MIIVDIPLQPISINHLYWIRHNPKTHTTFKILTTAGKNFKTQFKDYYKKQTQDFLTPNYRLKLAITVTFSDKHKRDLDNTLKVILDSLTGTAFTDDSQIDELSIKRAYEKDKPNIHIELEEIKELDVYALSLEDFKGYREQKQKLKIIEFTTTDDNQIRRCIEWKTFI